MLQKIFYKCKNFFVVFIQFFAATIGVCVFRCANSDWRTFIIRYRKETKNERKKL